MILKSVFHMRPEVGWLSLGRDHHRNSYFFEWLSVGDWSGVFTHTDGSIIVLYVDDVLAAASRELEYRHWQELGHKGSQMPILRYLGARCRLDEYCPKAPRAPRELGVSMRDYYAAAIKIFTERYGKRLPKVTSPYISDSDWAIGMGVAIGRYAPTCSSRSDVSIRQLGMQASYLLLHTDVLQGVGLGRSG